MDVANRDRVNQVAGEVAERFGGIDHRHQQRRYFTLLADRQPPSYEDNWAISLEVLLTAHTYTVRAALAYLRQSDAARIVNIASTEGLGRNEVRLALHGGQARRDRADEVVGSGARP